MNGQEALAKLQENGFIIAADAAKLITEHQNPDELYLFAIENLTDKSVLQAPDFEKKPEEKPIEQKPVIVEKIDFKPLAKEYDSQVEVMKNYKKENSISFGELDDFVDYFKSRYNKVSDILKTRNTENLTTIDSLARKRYTNVKLICIISDKKLTKNGHIFLKLEDLTGAVDALIPQNKQPLIRAGQRLIEDEIIMVEGKLSKSLFIVENFFEPDLPTRNYNGIQEELVLAALSDIHVGSKLFMEKNFNKMIDWINGKVGNERQRELAGRIKYITVAGDIADGIGVYPGQEHELVIDNMYDQYAEVEKLFMKIPDYIDIVMAPGDHDTVKKADPQPPFPKELVPQTYDLKNFTYISSPGMVKLHGLKTLVYHGTSFIDFIAHYSELNFENCAKSMVEMLKKRHIHPYYGGKPITPEKEDFMVIDEVPDIFHTGESHNNSYDFYRGTVCVNSGTWQAITEYIIKLGQKATPAVVPLVDMKRGKISAMHFDKEDI